ncbi:hypothetical protein ACLB2K_059456 [Fragaria x ananassa]
MNLRSCTQLAKNGDFFQLVNHGVSSELLDKVNQELEKFFKLPLEEKMRYRARPGDVEGYGIFIKSQDPKLEWHIRFFMITNPINRRKPHLFPELPTSLRNTLESFMSELQRIAQTLLGLMAKLLKVKMEEMEELFEDGLQTVKMSHYPPCPNPELVVGIKPHSDGSGITIVHQANEVQGLQIIKDEVWLPVSLDHVAFVVNLGDILEILSNIGIYRSVEHRVTVNSEKERISIAMFFMPRPGTEIGPLTSLRDPQKPPSSGNTGMEKFVKKYLSHYFCINTIIKCQLLIDWRVGLFQFCLY